MQKLRGLELSPGKDLLWIEGTTEVVAEIDKEEYGPVLAQAPAMYELLKDLQGILMAPSVLDPINKILTAIDGE